MKQFLVSTSRNKETRKMIEKSMTIRHRVCASLMRVVYNTDGHSISYSETDRFENETETIPKRIARFRVD
jgi:hypothetical protein